MGNHYKDFSKYVQIYWNEGWLHHYEWIHIQISSFHVGNDAQMQFVRLVLTQTLCHQSVLFYFVWMVRVWTGIPWFINLSFPWLVVNFNQFLNSRRTSWLYVLLDIIFIISFSNFNFLSPFQWYYAVNSECHMFYKAGLFWWTTDCLRTVFAICLKYTYFFFAFWVYKG